MDTDLDTIRRRPDGTIDISFYKASAVHARARAQRAWVAALLRRVRGLAAPRPKPKPQHVAQTG